MLEKRKVENNELERHIEFLKKLPVSSDLGKNGKWMSYATQPDNIVHNYRPYDNHNLPLAILHPVFPKFMIDVENITILPKEEESVYRMTKTMCGKFKIEDNRTEYFSNWSEEFFRRKAKLSRRFEEDPDISFVKVIENNIYLAIIEFKNEIGAGGDPYIQACGYYSKYILKKIEKGKKHPNTCLPTFLLYIMGPMIGIAGAVYSREIVISPLVSTSLIIPKELQSNLLTKITRIFCALKAGLDSIDKFHVNLSPEMLDNSLYCEQVIFPYIQQYVSRDKNLIKFVYVEQLLLLQNQLVFRIKRLPEGTNCIIKFVKTYGDDVHELCYTNGFAPELFAINTINLSEYKLVVMEDLEEQGYKCVREIWRLLSLDDRETLKSKINRAIKNIHSAKYVHGDMRIDNIMAKMYKTEWSIKIVNFDWAGTLNEAKYPLSILDEKYTEYHEDAHYGSHIKHEHDLHLIEKSYIR
ncbi:15990_t:CDS:2 [Entrophospora sp. SA101]|nr:5433_t:CDS:2 [Entrophospora sp. SA101]CAJ0925049.1 15990_t:CDS:2 [Entrophospora sp. SA101]